MGFLGSLGKGFIRSAVNQVGRDTGKVVSNRIYGNAHATPIKGISYSEGKYYDEINNLPINESEFAEKLSKEGFKVKYFTTNPFFKTILWSIGILSTSFISALSNKYYALIPPICLVFYATMRLILANKQMTIYINKEIATYKKDGRYSTGKRMTGYSTGKVEQDILPTRKFINKSWIIFLLYIGLAILMYLTGMYILTLENGDARGMWSAIGITSSSVFLILLIMHIFFRR